MSRDALDLVIANGRVVDGCGNPWFRADVGVRGDEVAAVAAPGTLRARRVVDAAERYVVPGFIDPHTHSDVSILQHPRAESAVLQGVTTHVTGNCGMAAAPIAAERRDDLVHEWGHYWDTSGVTWDWRTFAEYLREVEASGTAINIAPLAGHGALRIAVLGFACRQASGAEQAEMEALLDEAMLAGAHGLSSGLVYPPGCFASTEELVGLCRVVARHHGIYTSHIRGERETILAAVAEAIEIGRRAGCPVEVSHNSPKWGAPDGAAANLSLMDEARRLGVDVTTDNDTHTELAPRLSRALPQPLLELPADELVATLRDPGEREALRRAVRDDELPGAGYAGLLRHGRYDRIVVLHAPREPGLLGRSVAEIAAARGADPFDTYLDLIVEQHDEVSGIFEYMREDDIRALLTHPLGMVCSDGRVMPPAEGTGDPALYWPCSYGEYPRVLERYVRDEPVLRLEDAVRRMTSFPAQRFGLHDRGVLRPGLRADIVVVDLDRVRDNASNPFPHRHPFVNIPHRHPDGIDWVVVNGSPVVEDGEHTGALPGRVLRRTT
jgi:N-acyl-D-amino-acid deacylase